MKYEYWKFGNKYVRKEIKSDGTYQLSELSEDEVPDDAKGMDCFIEIVEDKKITAPIVSAVGQEKIVANGNQVPISISQEEFDKKTENYKTIPKQEPTKEMVNHPNHYGGDTTYECIKVLKNWMTKDEYIGFCKGNALKYLCRSGKKDEILQEYNKAKWYLEKMIECMGEN